MRCRQSYSRDSRRGTIAVLAAFMLIGFLAFVALAIDIGYIMVARTELQRTADAAAMAAVWELADEGRFKGDPYLSYAMANARSMATNYAGANPVCTAPPLVDANFANQIEGDVVIGHLANFSDPHALFDFSNPSLFNAVTVRVRRTANQNGLVPSFFSRFLGINGFVAHAEATAALASSISGFHIPGNGENVELLPFALDEPTWNYLMAGYAPDAWTWDADDGEIRPWPDGIREINLFPQGTGSPGNRGTVDIGSSNNSTNDIARQILHGVSPEDLEYHGGSLELDENGELFLNGDTGISAGIKDELETIKGKPRAIPLFRSVEGPGNNATYTIVGWAGIRIMEVQLTGQMSSKRVIIQPAPIVSQGAIHNETTGSSNLIFTPVQLVR
ncbi:MAG: Tad domain-containing protein [Pirellulales bacterium]|nr:Tad domain-containing protein [Pirellulales bacterium]